MTTRKSNGKQHKSQQCNKIYQPKYPSLKDQQQRMQQQRMQQQRGKKGTQRKLCRGLFLVCMAGSRNICNKEMVQLLLPHPFFYACNCQQEKKKVKEMQQKTSPPLSHFPLLFKHACFILFLGHPLSLLPSRSSYVEFLCWPP